jgi:large subunit ribosomal protein L2
MGKRIIQQARGHGSLTYRVRKKAFRIRIGYCPTDYEGKAVITKIINSPAHSAPIAKINYGEMKKVFYTPCADKCCEGQEIEINGNEIKTGNIIEISKAPIGTRVFNVEKRLGDGGKMVRCAGSSAVVVKKNKNSVGLLMSNKKEVWISGNARVSVGIVAGDGRKDKPIMKAGKKYYMMKAKSKLWPRTSAVKMNAIDHPFGSGRGKRIKSKIAKRNAPAGARVGLIQPRRTGIRGGKR